MKHLSQREGVPPHAGALEAIGMVLLCFGCAIFGALAAMSGPVRMIGFSDDLVAAMALFNLVLGGAALAVLHVRGYPLRCLIPRLSWQGAMTGVGLYLCTALTSLLVVRLAPHQAGSPLGDMVPAAHVSWYVIAFMALVSGSYEEITVLLRVLSHMSQGPWCALSMALFGLPLAVYYHYRGRLFPVVLAHVIAVVVAFYYQSA
jgi:membrane protease YdiL (CAAX protease family)